jgi:hypothetical protein
MIFETAHQMGLVPFLWLCWLRVRGEERGSAWWWLAIAFLVSWFADSAVDLGAPSDMVNTVYQVSQSALIGAVLLDRSDAVVLTITLCLVGIAAVLWNHLAGPDVLLSTVASLAIAGIAYERRALTRVRWSLLVMFGAGWVAWMGYCLAPGWTFYLLYQATRAVGIGLFCWASWNPRPQFRLARSVR